MNNKSLSEVPVLKYPDYFICFYCVQLIRLVIKQNLILRYEARVNPFRASSMSLCAASVNKVLSNNYPVSARSRW